MGKAKALIRRVGKYIKGPERMENAVNKQYNKALNITRKISYGRGGTVMTKQGPKKSKALPTDELSGLSKQEMKAKDRMRRMESFVQSKGYTPKYRK